MKKAIIVIVFIATAGHGFAQDAEFYNLYFEGNAAFSLGQYDKAIEKYNAALKIAKADYLYYNRGNAYYAKKEYDKALADYNQTILMNKNYAEAYCQRGLIKAVAGDRTSCDDFRKAVKLEFEGGKELLRKICR